MSFINGGIFGQPTQSSDDATPAQERKASQYWLNVGYVVTAPNAAGQPEERFISLPFGLGIDTMSSITKFSRNAAIAKMQSASNDLLRQLQEGFASLQPGEEKVLAGDCQGLRLQLRRVGNTPTEVDNESNEYTTKINF